MRTLFKLLILCAFFASTTAPAFAAAALIEMVAGVGANPVVQVKRAGASLSLKKGDELKPGDELTTDRASAVDIRLEDRTLIRVGANSSYRLEEDSAAKKLIHRLVSGIVRILVPKSDKPSANVKFEMRTAEGTIGVRGTEFVVIKSDGETQLKGLEGEVTFGGAGAAFAEAARFVPVRGGFESRVKAGAAAPGAATAFDLATYLRTLDSPEGPFKGLVARAKANVKARASEPAKAAPVVAAPAAPAPRVPMKAALAKAAPKAEAPKNDPNAQLFHAAGKGDVKGIEAALKAGADVNHTFELKVTALHMAVLSDSDSAVIVLIKKGADVNARDANGRTPLMTVARDGGKAQLVIALQESGADQSIKDSDGKTALELAEESLSLATEPAKKTMFQEIVSEIKAKP